MAHLSIWEEFMDIPPVTRGYSVLCILITVLVQLDLITPFQLYFNPLLVIQKYQIWRLVTCFTFLGTFGFNFLFNMIFTYRYCRMLEEGSFRGKTADFLFMILFGGAIMLFMALFFSSPFLGQAFTMMLVYVWGRRNPFIRMNFFGFTFNAPYLPWILLGFSFLLLSNSVMVDLLGISVGHIYFFLEDVFPNRAGGIKLLKTPAFLKWLCEPAPEVMDNAETNAGNEEQPMPGGLNFNEGI